MSRSNERTVQASLFDQILKDRTYLNSRYTVGRAIRSDIPACS
jgi:hypothetical protein